LFLVPKIRSQVPAADLNLKIHLREGEHEGVHSPGTAEHDLTINPGEETVFIVSGTIPHDVRTGERTGDIFLLDVAAHYPPRSRVKKAVVQYTSKSST
jgi:hypothetical protein